MLQRLYSQTKAFTDCSILYCPAQHIKLLAMTLDVTSEPSTKRTKIAGQYSESLLKILDRILDAKESSRMDAVTCNRKVGSIVYGASMLEESSSIVLKLI